MKINDKLLRQWDKELHAAVETLDLQTFKEFQEKWIDLGVYKREVMEKATDTVLEISIMKMAMALPNITPETRRKAKEWLTFRGYDTSLF